MKFKNQMTCTLLFLMATLFSNNLSAQKVEVSPKPQIISWGSNKAFNNNVSYKLVGAETADADAVNLFKKNFTIADNGVEVIIGEIDDPVIKALNIFRYPHLLHHYKAFLKTRYIFLMYFRNHHLLL